MIAAERDIWVEFNDIATSGTVTTYADLARPGADLSVGSPLVAGDGEGNSVRAVVLRHRARWGKAAEITLRLDMGTFSGSEDNDEDRTTVG